MNPRLRLGLILLSMVSFIAFVIWQMVTQLILPFSSWRRERAADFAVFQHVRRLKTRPEVEQTLSSWQRQDLNSESANALCLQIARSDKTLSPDSCRAVTLATNYQRHRESANAPGLPPLRVVVLYDAQGRMVAATTRD